ncbi:hypothetical protein AWI38_001396 [Vibrio parahaemolyticus]|nr:hypothetical protein [Vibrio parahaemolyticus]EJK2425627.1 hypothetical protein [Vibrio parahaemolyticus]
MTKYATDIFYSADIATLNKAKHYVEQTYKTQCETCQNFLFITEELANQNSTERDAQNEIYESVFHELIYSLQYMFNDTTQHSQKSVDIAQECDDIDTANNCINEYREQQTFSEFIDLVFEKHGELFVHNGSDDFYTKEQVVEHMHWLYSTNSYLFSDTFDESTILNKLSQ